MSPIRNAFVRMAAQQMATDLRTSPGALARRWTDAGRAERCGSLEELRRAARRSLPRTVFDFLDGAATDEVTGGRQLDHAPSTISVLAGIVEAVGDSVEVYLDGGVRRGTDVVTALALGARACLVGRPLLYGLAVAGQVGAARAVSLLADEVRTTMTLMGCDAIGALDESWIESGWTGARSSPDPTAQHGR